MKKTKASTTSLEREATKPSRKSQQTTNPKESRGSVSLEIDKSIVHLKWTDSTSWNRWQSHDDIAAFAHTVEPLIDSVGIVVGATKDNLTIVQNVSTGNKSMAIKIPKVAIKSMKIIGKI